MLPDSVTVVLPNQRVAAVHRRTVCERVVHLWYEDVLHGGLQVWVGIEDGVEFHRGAVQLLVLQC